MIPPACGMLGLIPLAWFHPHPSVSYQDYSYAPYKKVSQSLFAIPRQLQELLGWDIPAIKRGAIPVLVIFTN